MLKKMKKKQDVRTYEHTNNKRDNENDLVVSRARKVHREERYIGS